MHQLWIALARECHACGISLCLPVVIDEVDEFKARHHRRHEIVVRILWRGPDEGLYTLGLHMHNSLQSFVLQRAGPSPPAFLCP